MNISLPSLFKMLVSTCTSLATTNVHTHHFDMYLSLLTHTHTHTPQSTLMLENTQVRHTSGPSITSHSQLHTDLLNYSSLTKWLKECEPVRFSEVMEVILIGCHAWCDFIACYSQAYVRSFRRVYEDEIRALVSEARVCLLRGGGIELKRPGGLLGKMGSNTDLRRSQLTSSLQVLSPSSRGGAFISQSVADFSASTALASPGSQDHSNSNRPKLVAAGHVICCCMWLSVLTCTFC